MLQCGEKNCIAIFVVDSCTVRNAGMYCKNNKSSCPVSNLFSSNKDDVLQSDDDEQLLIVLPFTAQVRISAINFVGPKNDARPVIVKLFINATNMGFSDAEDFKPTQVLKLEASDMDSGRLKELNFVNFQRVNSITIFVEENAGADETILNQLTLFGEPTEEMDLAAWQPIKG